VTKFYNGRGTAEQWIKEGKNAINWTRLSCHGFRNNEVRLQLHVLAYNMGNFLRTLALPEAVEHWSLTTLREKTGQDWCQSRRSRPVRHVPIGRGGGAERLVPEDPAANRWSTPKTRPGVGRGNRRQGEIDRRGVSR
jgi:hypothetical protein